MGVIDLNVRLTKEWGQYNDFLKSSDSLIFIDPDTFIGDDLPSSIHLTVGKRCFHLKDNVYYDIPIDGIQVKPFTTILVETEQKLGLPFNIFGLVTGKGNLIFKGAFVSSAKIDPGFQGKLRIALFNGSDNMLIIKNGDPLCSCVFLNMDTSMRTPFKNYEEKFEKANYWHTKIQSFKLWVIKNKDVIMFLTSLIAILISIVAIVLSKNFVLYKSK